MLRKRFKKKKKNPNKQANKQRRKKSWMLKEPKKRKREVIQTLMPFPIGLLFILVLSDFIHMVTQGLKFESLSPFIVSD